MSYLKKQDQEIFDAIQNETKRQQEGMELIASENYASAAVMEAMGSVFTNKYSEGYPRKRYYGGQEFVDTVEELAIDRAKQLFAAETSMCNATRDLPQTSRYIWRCCSRVIR